MVVFILICAFIFIGWLEIPELLKKNSGRNLQLF